MKISGSEIRDAMRNGGVTRDWSGLFSFEFPGGYGGTITRTASAALVREKLNYVAELFGDPVEMVRDYLNGITPERWEEAVTQHGMGELLDTKEVVVQTADWTGTGGTSFKKRMALVRVSADQEYPPDDFYFADPAKKGWDAVRAGDLIWIRDDRLRELERV